ncbi:MAG: HEAT repeat domain-containing protein [Kofleriaceae bacterium]|jgi:aminopeptidase N|nr:HEAT repeat domain-containing protein [Kofleriaceae bacterium]
MSRPFAFPGTRPRFAADRVVDIEHLRLTLTVDPAARTLRGSVALTITVLAPDTRWVELDAVELTIEAVSTGGRPLGHAHDGRRLRVDLGVARPAGETLTLDITYHGAPRRGLYFVGPDPGYPDKPTQVWTQGQDEDSRFWFPCFDAPHEKATSEVVVTVPAALTALSNGVLLSDREDGAGARTLHWRLDVPHSCYLVTLVVGDFATVRDHWRDLEVTYHVPRGREADAQRTLGRTPQMLDLFSRRFGLPYPYPRYAQVCVADFIFGGMENTSATTLTDAVLLDERAALDHDVDALVAHELAHQWFGDLVTCRDWGEGWLNEGFATYAEYLWREHHEGRDAADLELEDWAAAYFGEDRTRYRRTIATKLYDEPIDIFDHHLYDKGGRVLHMLRQVLGDPAFFASLARYLGKHRLGVVETRDLARAVEDATGRVLDWFFAQWVVDGAGHPELAVDLRWDPDTHQLVARVDQTQRVEGATPLFRLPTSLRVRVGGRDRDLPIELRDAHHVFHLPLPEAPSAVIFDPGRVLLAQVKTDKREAWWRAELAEATLATDRMAAAAALGKAASPAALAALDQASRADPYWAVRGAAATALADLGGVRARDLLVARLGDEQHPRARAVVARALGGFPGDEVAGAALAELVERGDPSYFVEAAACLALGKTRSSRAGATLRRAAERPSFADVIRQHAFRGLAEARDQAATPLLLEGTRWGRPSQGRRAAAGALATLHRGRRDADAAGVRDHLEQLLVDRDFRVQAAAIEACAVWADPASIGALDRLVARELDGRLRRRAREVSRDLAEGNPATDEVRRLRDELDEVKQRLRALHERLDGLDAARAAKAERKAEKQARKRERKER